MSTIPLNLETDTVALPEPVLRTQATLEQALKLTQRIPLAQTVGYPGPGA